MRKLTAVTVGLVVVAAAYADKAAGAVRFYRTTFEQDFREVRTSGK